MRGCRRSVKRLWLVSVLVLGVLAIPSQALATTGKLQVCKKATGGSGVTGTFSFLVHDSTGDRTVTASVGGCSSVFTATQQTTVTETANPGTQLDKISVVPAARRVEPGCRARRRGGQAEPSRKVVVTFTNGLPQTGFLVICKVSDDGFTAGELAVRVHGHRARWVQRLATVPVDQCSLRSRSPPRWR